MGHHLVISCAFIQLQSQQIGEPKIDGSNYSECQARCDVGNMEEEGDWNEWGGVIYILVEWLRWNELGPPHLLLNQEETPASYD